MVKLSLQCTIVGQAGSSFDVEIDDSVKVSKLKKAVKVEKPITITCEADQLQLFLAKKEKGAGAWVTEADVNNGVNDTDGLTPLDVAGAPLNLVGLSGTDVQFTPTIEDVKAKSTPVHVLVVVPPQDDLRSPAMTLLEAILPYVLTSAPTTLTDGNKGFKDELCDFYGCYSRKKSCVRCMLLDVAFPNSLVIASHLFRRSNENVSLVMMQISDIDDVRNGLLLFKPLEHAFDHFQISFIRDDTDTFCLKLFDPSIRDTPLIDLKDRHDNKVLSTEQTELLLGKISSRKKPCRFNVRTTFGDVEGRALTFTGLGRPYNRCLNLQARVARMIALKKDRIDASYDFKDFWSDVSLDDKMEMFQRSIANSNAKF